VVLVKTDVSEEEFLCSVRQLLVTVYVVPPKRRLLKEPHDVTSQKTAFFTVTAANASNLTQH
jgi:hypothetical protein